MRSDAWGFYVDPPVDYAFVGGDGRDTFSFAGAGGAALEIKAYGAGQAPEAVARDTARRLGSGDEAAAFDYRGRRAAIFKMAFTLGGRRMAGWGLCVELAGSAGLVLALAYGPGDQGGLEESHLSALDSLAPAPGDRRAPGPVTAFAYPRVEETRRRAPVAGLGVEAWFYGNDAEAAQALVDREFAVLERYAGGPLWREAWKRYYRAIYRDSFERLADAAFVVERSLSAEAGADGRDLAGLALSWVQGFEYERDTEGSDFVNLVSAALEGRGDCDSRALLWALVLNQANVPAGLMVSREYGHAMGFADVAGEGARFEGWLVAETTAPVAVGMIGANVADPARWLGIKLDGQ